MHEWIEQLLASLRALYGRFISRWQGVEMAVREDEASGQPVWEDVSVPFLQLERLDLAFSEGDAASIGTYQSYHYGQSGLDLGNPLPRLRELPNLPGSITKICRTRILDELPKGIIRSVSVSLYKDDIAEVWLGIGGHEARLLAGDVYEQPAGPLRVATMDESILVQVDGRRPQTSPKGFKP